MSRSGVLLCPWRWANLVVVTALLCLPHRTSAQPLFYAGSEEASNAMISDSNILVTTNRGAYWGITPADTNKWRDVGIIYYSATFYDERVYAPVMRQMAVRNFPAFILDLPLSLAFLTPFRADLVIRDHPQIRRWVVAGHGVGGAIASCYAQSRRVEGLALFSSYPFPLFNNLKGKDIEVISLWGSQDGITNRQQWEDGKLALPDDTLFLEIDGGNHSQMAWLMNLVNGDGEASIDRNTQQVIVVNQLRMLMETIEDKFDDDIILDDDCVLSSGDSHSGSDSYSSDSADEFSPSSSESISYDCRSGSRSRSSSSDSRSADSRDFGNNDVPVRRNLRYR